MHTAGSDEDSILGLSRKLRNEFVGEGRDIAEDSLPEPGENFKLWCEGMTHAICVYIRLFLLSF